MNSNDSHDTEKSHWPVSLISAAVSAFNTILPLLLVRLLDKTDIGTFRIFFLYLSTLPNLFFSPGLINGIAYWSGQSENARERIRASGVFLLCIALCASCVLFFASPWVSLLIGWDEAYCNLLSLSLIGAVASLFYEESAISFGKVWAGARYHAISEILRMLAIVITALITQSIYAVLLSHTVISLTKTAVGYSLAWKGGYFRISVPVRFFKDVFSYAWPVSLAAAGAVPLTFADKLILSTRLSEADFAVYSIGCLSLGPLFMIEHSITRVIIPQISRAVSQDNMKMAASLYSHTVRHLALVFIPSTVGLIVFAEPLITILFTSNYSDASPYLRLYAFTYLAFVIPHDAVARARGDSIWIFRTFTGLSICTLVITFLMTWIGGPFGALTSIVLAALALRILGLRYIKQHTDWHYGEFLPLQTIKQVSVFSLSLGVAALALEMCFTSVIYWFLCTAPLYGVLVTIFCIRLENRIFSLEGKSNPHVLTLVQSLEPGGIERLAATLSTGLTQHGYKTTLWAYDTPQEIPSELAESVSAQGVHVLHNPKKPGFSVKLIIDLTIYCIKQQVHIIHCHDIGALMYASMVKILTIGRVKVLMTQHSFIHLEKYARYATFEKIFSRFALLSAVSPQVVEYYRANGISTKPVALVLNGVAFCDNPINSVEELLVARQAFLSRCDSQKHPVEELQSADTQLWMLYLARLYPQKGQDTLLEILSHPQFSPDVPVIVLLAGPESDKGYADSLRALSATKLGTKPNLSVCFFGPTSTPLELLQVCDIVVSASASEGLPLVPIEALGHRVPCILSDIEGHRLFADSAMLFPLTNTEQACTLVQKMCAHARNERFHSEKSQEIMKSMRETYSFQAMINTYRSLYETLLK